jgi:transposase
MEERGTLRMSRKERESLVVMERVRRKEMKLAEAAQMLGITYRQSRRRYQRYRERGALGLVHRSRGARSNRALSEETRKEIVEHYRGRYEGFGPVLFAEKLLSAHEIKVDHETLRRLLVKEGLWLVTRKRKKRHKAWIERRGHFGEMVQMDGSHHLWFEERGDAKRCCLMVMIDDATGIRMSLLAEGETTEAAMRLLWMWIKRYGVPKCLYTDKKNVYVPSEKDQENARLEGREVLTQFGKACSKLGIKIVRAHSPQAKGRVERSNAVYQDRLVKELRLEQISEIDKANDLLQGGFDQDLNRRFAVEAREKADFHRPACLYDLPGIFCIEQERTLSVNWTLSFETSVYQIKAGSANYSPARTQIQVRRYLDGELHMFYRGNEVSFEEIDPEKNKKKKFIKGRNRPLAEGRESPRADHPWRTPIITSREPIRQP